MRRIRREGESRKNQRKEGDRRPKARERPTASCMKTVGRKRGVRRPDPRDEDEKEKEEESYLREIDIKKVELNYDEKIVKMNERRQQENEGKDDDVNDDDDDDDGDNDDDDDDDEDDDKKMIKGCLMMGYGKERDGGRKKANKNSSHFYVQRSIRVIILATVRANRCRRGGFVFDNG